MKRLLGKLKKWAGSLKKQLVIIYLVSKDDRTPWYAKWLIYLMLAYALSPIDLIPDFIPVIGFLDDLILLPIGIYLAISLTPKSVYEDARINAATYQWSPGKNWFGFALVIISWIVIATLIVYKFIPNS